MVTKEDLQQSFGPYGEITDIFLTRSGKGTAFLSFAEPEAVRWFSRRLEREESVGNRSL